MSNTKYDKEKVLEIYAEYLLSRSNEEITSVSFEKLYSQVAEFASVSHPDIKMPAVSQMRKIIIAELGIEKGTRLTSEVVCRLKNIYYDDTNLKSVLKFEYQVTTSCDGPIICVIQPPPTELIESMADYHSTNEGKTLFWGYVKSVNILCKKIKDKEPSLILAVIPEYNNILAYDHKGELKQELPVKPVCTSLCMFIKNTPKGKKFAEKLYSASSSFPH